MRPIAVNESGIRLDLDFDKDELEWIVIDNVMLDALLPSICLSSDERTRHLRSAAVDEQVAGGHRHHDIIHLMSVPAGVAARRKTPFGDDASIVVDLNGGCSYRSIGDGDSGRQVLPHILWWTKFFTCWYEDSSEIMLEPVLPAEYLPDIGRVLRQEGSW